MRRTYLIGPCLCALAGWICGNGLLPILPLYAIQKGASASTSGLFLAFSYLCLAVGTIAAGLVPKRFRQRRLTIVVSGILQVVLTWLAGRTQTVLQLGGVIGATWFLGGIVFVMSATVVGLVAPLEERGLAFGIYGMTNGLGGLIGSIVVGWVADHFGYTMVFNCLAVACLLTVIGGLVSVEPPVPSAAVSAGPSPAKGSSAGGVLVALLAGQLLVAIALGPGALGRSLSMDTQKYTKFAITVTQAIQGLVSIGFALSLGRLSDRIGRRPVFMAACAAVTLSLVILAFSRLLWHFCAFAVLFSFISVPSTIGPAFVVDIDPQGNVGRGVSLIQAMFWLGCIAGMAGAGVAIERLGAFPTIFVSGLLPIAGAIMVFFVRPKSSPIPAQ